MEYSQLTYGTIMKHGPFKIELLGEWHDDFQSFPLINQVPDQSLLQMSAAESALSLKLKNIVWLNIVRTEVYIENLPSTKKEPKLSLLPMTPAEYSISRFLVVSQLLLHHIKQNFLSVIWFTILSPKMGRAYLVRWIRTSFLFFCTEAPGMPSQHSLSSISEQNLLLTNSYLQSHSNNQLSISQTKNMTDENFPTSWEAQESLLGFHNFQEIVLYIPLWIHQ